MKLTREKIVRWGKLLLTYFMGQGMMQLIQLLSGFALIRWLSKGDYATFTLVMAILGTSSVLVEMGISQSLTALIGKKIVDPRAVGRYVAACRYYRDRMLWVGGALLLGIFIWIAPRYGWGGGLWFWLWLSVIGSLVFQAWGSIYSPILLLEERLKDMYAIGVASGLYRLAFLAAAWLAGILTAPLALIYGALQALIGGWGAREKTRSKLISPARGEDLSREKKELLSQALPRAPSITFYAFEGQITIFLISIFGTTAGIAELGALNRLAMLFLILKMTGNILIAPYMAKLERPQILSRSLGFLGAAGIFFLLASAFAAMFPEPLLWILGEGYQHLHFEVFLIIMASSVRLITMVLFNLCVARKYIFPWFSIAELVPLIITMVAGFMIFDMGSLTGVLYYSLAMAAAKLGSSAFMFAYGLRRELRGDKVGTED